MDRQITQPPTLRRIAAVLVTALVMIAGHSPTGASDDPRPPLPSLGLSAPGVDVPCDPTSERPVPVILIHGTRADRTMNWLYLGPELAERGFCVYSVDLPDRGQAPLAESLVALSQRVEEVLAGTGAEKVSLFGHSLGGLVARDFVKRGGDADIVDDVIAMGTPHTGYYTEPPGDQIDVLFNTSCAACDEMAQGSAYMLELNDGDQTPGSASYTSIITEYDGVALPLESQYLPEGPEVANVLLQEACPDHLIDHLTLALDPLVRDWVVNALDQVGPADEDRLVDCVPAP